MGEASAEEGGKGGGGRGGSAGETGEREGGMRESARARERDSDDTQF